MISTRKVRQPERTPISHRVGSGAKRATDIFVSLLGLALLLPIFGVIAVLIKRDSVGPVFFRGKRTAKGGGAFDMLKFRTMYETRTSYEGPKVTGQDDQRITPVGRWLRETKLNELPQLWNVLTGDMSLVGPRPEDPDIAATWPKEARREILSVRPGITSPASVQFRNEEALLSSEQVMTKYLMSITPSKMRLDQLYVRHRSLLLDWDVIFWTLVVIMPRLGTFQPPEAQLFRGPVARFIRHHLSWFSIDVLIIFAAFGCSGLFWRSLGPLHIGWTNAISVAFAFTMLFSMTAALLGVNRIAWSRASVADVFDLVPAIAFASGVILATNSYMELFPPRMILMSCVLACGGIIVARYRSRLISALATRLLSVGKVTRAGREHVLIVGGGEAGQFAAWMLSNSPGMWTYHIVGFVDDDWNKSKLRIRGVKVLGTTEDIQSLAEKHDVGIVIFAIHNIYAENRQVLLDACYRTSARVVVMPDFMGSLTNAAAQDRKEKTKQRMEPIVPGIPEISVPKL